MRPGGILRTDYTADRIANQKMRFTMKHSNRYRRLGLPLSAVAALAGCQPEMGSMMRIDGDPRTKVTVAATGQGPARFPGEPHSAMTSRKPSAMLMDLEAPLAEPEQGSVWAKPAAFPQEPQPSGSRK